MITKEKKELVESIEILEIFKKMNVVEKSLLKGIAIGLNYKKESEIKISLDKVIEVEEGGK